MCRYVTRFFVRHDDAGTMLRSTYILALHVIYIRIVYVCIGLMDVSGWQHIFMGQNEMTSTPWGCISGLDNVRKMKGSILIFWYRIIHVFIVSILLEFGTTIRAVPRTRGLFRQAHTIKVKPFEFTIIVVTTNHLTI
jgi:hypothetical protein